MKGELFTALTLSLKGLSGSEYLLFCACLVTIAHCYRVFLSRKACGSVLQIG